MASKFLKKLKLLIHKNILWKISSNKQVFGSIYSNNLWGYSDNPGLPFFSGEGSNHENTKEFVALVKDFIHEKNIQSILDVGCGDFRVGAQLCTPDLHYIGVDVVKELIEFNRNEFETQTVEFWVVDAVRDNLPNAELCLVRQVLQHLSNEQIMQVIPKLRKFRYVIILEHVLGEDEPNLDKKVGDHIRDNSGVYLDKPPFSLPAKVIHIQKVPFQNFPNSCFRTLLLENDTIL
jgi:SAM-dependent methyltransferase